jgi:hypothetical protein
MFKINQFTGETTIAVAAMFTLSLRGGGDGGCHALADFRRLWPQNQRRSPLSVTRLQRFTREFSRPQMWAEGGRISGD